MYINAAIRDHALNSGGIHQRAENARIFGMDFDAGRQATKPSCLATELLELHAMGLLSCSLVQRLAMAAVEDGCAHTEVQALARLGAGGMQRQNCFRDMTRLYRISDESVMPLHYLAWIPILDSSVNPPTVKFVLQPIMLAHRLFGTMYANFPKEFARLLGRGVGDVVWVLG